MKVKFVNDKEDDKMEIQSYPGLKLETKVKQSKKKKKEIEKYNQECSKWQ